jgi:hypothetical protein
VEGPILSFLILGAIASMSSFAVRSVTGTSTATNATPWWVYPLIPQKDDVDYGVGAYLLLASELANETW